MHDQYLVFEISRTKRSMLIFGLAGVTIEYFRERLTVRSKRYSILDTHFLLYITFNLLTKNSRFNISFIFGPFEKRTLGDL